MRRDPYPCRPGLSASGLPIPSWGVSRAAPRPMTTRMPCASLASRHRRVYGRWGSWRACCTSSRTPVG